MVAFSSTSPSYGPNILVQCFVTHIVFSYKYIILDIRLNVTVYFFNNGNFGTSRLSIAWA